MGRKRIVKYEELVDYLNMRKANGRPLTLQEIADKIGCSRQAVAQAKMDLNPTLIKKKDLKEYVSELPLTLADAEQKILRYMLSPEKLAKASSAQLAMIFGVMFDKRRLTQGQSTSNVHVVLETMDQNMKEELLQAIKVNTQKMLEEARNIETGERY